MPKGYFFIITPFQYLSALEARNHFKKELNKVFLFVLHTKLSSRQLHSIIDENLWDNVIYTKDLKVNWPIKFINLLFKILQIFKRRYYLLHNIGKIKKNDYLFIGNLNVQWLRWIVWKGKMEKIIILDDGFSILNALSYINNSKHKLTSKDNLLIWLEEIVFPTKKLELNKVILFSIFNKIDTTSAKIIYNNLSYIKEKFGHKNYENYEIVYFIGQPFVALNLIPKIKYISIINCIKTFYENKGIEFKYCIHRTENILDYPSSWDILSFDYPIDVGGAELFIQLFQKHHIVLHVGERLENFVIGDKTALAAFGNELLGFAVHIFTLVAFVDWCLGFHYAGNLVAGFVELPYRFFYQLFLRGNLLFFFLLHAIKKL